MTRTVLLVEDDDLKARVVTRVIEKHGLAVERVTNVRDAVRAWTIGGPFVAVVTDWMFPTSAGGQPGRNGHIVYELFANSSNTVPTVVVSGSPPEPGYTWINALELLGELRSWLERNVKR